MDEPAPADDAEVLAVCEVTTATIATTIRTARTAAMTARRPTDGARRVVIDVVL
ncbi:MAG TPA: hypothetical protein VMF07_10570 [Solirubrobacteraceae bacterium]|nr:hypothetical protein [Solirubrobacteraceae bacterium]